MNEQECAIGFDLRRFRSLSASKLFNFGQMLIFAVTSYLLDWFIIHDVVARFRLKLMSIQHFKCQSPFKCYVISKKKNKTPFLKKMKKQKRKNALLPINCFVLEIISKQKPTNLISGLHNKHNKTFTWSFLHLPFYFCIE